MNGQTLVLICIGASLVFVVSAIILLALCIMSSRFSQEQRDQQGRED